MQTDPRAVRREALQHAQRHADLVAHAAVGGEISVSPLREASTPVTCAIIAPPLSGAARVAREAAAAQQQVRQRDRHAVRRVGRTRRAS